MNRRGASGWRPGTCFAEGSCGGLCLRGVAGAGGRAAWAPWPAQAGRWGKDYVPNVPVVTQDGKTLNFYDDLIKDKIVVFSFIYTSCKDICPLATARLAEVQDKLGDRIGRDIFFYSISIDPEHDTPSA